MTREEAQQHIEQIRGEKLKADSSDLRAALKLLAEELNSKETHFILELLQNAEDNEYAGKEPELGLTIVDGNPTNTASADGCLVALNNELGFQPENVRSLSSVGKSTKKERNQGYIGEKGIGFKSVFRVTESPHIFSNGLQFRFQTPTEAEGFGYILPHWVESVPPVVKEGFTAILLPLQPGKREIIANQLSKIAPETLLFLKKLKRLDLGHLRSISRHGESPLVHLSSNDGESVYFVYNQQCEKPSDFTEEKRQGVSKRDVTIAFPLKTTRACTGRIYAFLPTEFDSGFPFLFNTDFILNFNRERVLEDRRWNHWLRDEIAPTFANAFLSVLKEPEWRAGAWQFLPIESDLAPGAEFFAPVIAAINTKLKKEKCILTDEGGAELPEKVFSPGKLARQILQNAPREKFDFSLLNPGWDSDWQKRLKPLGVQSLTFAQVFSVCNNESWLKSRDLEWWETLLELCAACDLKSETVGAFPILLCQDGNPRSLSADVFFHAETKPTQAEILSDWPSAHFLDVELQNRLEKKPAIMTWLIKVAGIQVFSVHAYITGHLLKWMCDQTGEQAGARLVAATCFIAKNLQNRAEQTDKILREQMPWFLASGQVLLPANRLGKELVTPECIEADSGWNWVFISEQDRQHFWLLNDAYFAGCQDAGKDQIRKLMVSCGATDYPDPARRSLPSGLYNWDCPRWLKDLDVAKPPSNLNLKAAAIERWIGRFKPENFAKFLICANENGLVSGMSEAETSDLGLALKARPWLNSTKGLVCPSTAFVEDPEFREFLHDSVPYVISTLQKDILGKLGVRLRLSATTLIDLLRQMKESGQPDEALAVRVYQRLQTMEFNSEVFRQESLILLCWPTVRWMNTNQVFWRDVGPVFDQNFGYASLTYGEKELHGFFTKKLGIPDQPEAKEYAAVWVQMGKEGQDGQIVVEGRLEEILPRIAEAIDVEALPDWWPRLRRALKVWTLSGHFIDPRTVFAPDDAIAEELFAENATIAWAPETHLTARVNRLFVRLGCRSLAAQLKSFPLTATPIAPTTEARFLTPATKELLFCWICDAGDWTKKKHELELMLRTDETEVPELVIEYWLENSDVPKTNRNVDGYWASNDRRLYLRQGATTKAQQAAVAATVAGQFFRNDKKSTDTVYRLLGLEPADAGREKLERKWILSTAQKEWLRDLGIELKVLDVTTSKGRTTQRESRPATGQLKSKSDSALEPDNAQKEQDQQRPEKTNTTEPDAPSSETTASSSAENDSQTNFPVDSNQPAKTEVDNSDTEDSDDQDADNGEPLKPADTEVDFVHVAAYTRSLPRADRGRSKQSANRTQDKNPLTKITPKSKAELEERAVQIIRHQFQKHPDLKGFTLVDRRKDSCGYDIHAAKPGRVLRIEIKAHAREAKSVFVTKKEWDESKFRNRIAADDRWELWNVENIASETGKARITRYVDLPIEARSHEVGYWVDLNACQSESA
jgi:hypothetical protein